VVYADCQGGGIAPGETSMIEQRTIDLTGTLDPTTAASLGTSETSRLSLTWVMDPITGKPVARWIAEPTATRYRKSLALAA